MVSTGAAHLSVRQSAEGRYTASIDVNGQVALYRGEVLLGSATVDPVPQGQWRTLRLSVIEDIVRVSVDGVEVIALWDAQPLAAGAVSFAASDLGESVLLVDDAEIWVPLTDLPLPDEPELGLLFSDNFDAGDLSAWTLGAGWLLSPQETGQALQITNSAEAAVLNLDSYFNAAAQAQFLFNAGTVQITVRESETGRFTAALSIDGQVSLYRADELLGSASVDSWVPDGWHTLRLSAMEDVLRVSVDGTEVIAVQNPEPLATGSVSFAGSDLGESVLLVDNFELWVPLDEMPTETLVEEPELAVFFRDNFDETAVRPWLPNDWRIDFSNASLAIVTQGQSPVRFIDSSLNSVVVEAVFQISGGSVKLAVRESETGAYSAVFSPNGQVILYRGEEMLELVTTPPSDVWTWHRLRLSAIENTLRVTLDGNEIIALVDAEALPAGTVSISGAFSETGPSRILRVDEVSIKIPVADVASFPPPTSLPLDVANLPGGGDLAISESQSQMGTLDFSSDQVQSLSVNSSMVGKIAYTTWFVSGSNNPREDIHIVDATGYEGVKAECVKGLQQLQKKD